MVCSADLLWLAKAVLKADADMGKEKPMLLQKKEYFKQEYQSFQDYSLHVERVTVNQDFMEHTHEFDEIVIVVSGSGEHLVEQQVYSLSRGDVFVIKGDVKHGFRNNSNLQIINLMYDPRMLFGENEELRFVEGFDYMFIIQPEWLPHLAYPYRVTMGEETVRVVELLTDFLIEQLRDAKGQYYVAVKYGFKALISYIANNYRTEQHLSDRMKILASAIQYIRSNLNTSIKVTDIAKSVTISPRQLERVFAEECGMSPIEYLTELRLKHARTLLMNTERPISAVAEEAGFEDPSYFARVYKKRFNLSPSQARKQN